MLRALLALSALFFAAGHACAGDLMWGLRGAGGTGTWDTSSAGWFDGTGNVAWPTQPKFASAVFGGTAGTVTISGSVAADQVTFQTGGYVIADFFLIASSNGLTVTTNADATINAAVFADTNRADVNGTTFTKLGAGTLTLTTIAFFHQINVNAGQILASAGGGTANARYTFLPGSGATVGLGGSTSDTFVMGALDGGGANEGVVLTDATAGKRTLSLTAYSGSYAGTLQDNGADVLAVSVGNVAQTLTAANSYTGATTLTGAQGSLTLAGAGTARNTTVTVKSGALVLDNSGTNLPDRISDTAPLSLAGTLTLKGGSAAGSSETAGMLLTPSGMATIVLQPDPAQATTLNLAGLTGRSTTNYGLLLVQGLNPGAGPGSATLRFTTAPAMVNGLVPGVLGGAAPGTTFTTYDASGLRAYADSEYVANSLSGGTTSLVNLTGANTLNGTAAISALRLQGGASLSGGGTLQVAGGAVLALAGSEQINLGALDFGAGEGLLITHGDLLLRAPVTGTATGMALTKAGNGTLTLASPGTYQGLTTVTAGTLRLTDSGALGATTAGTIVESGATLDLSGNLAVGAEPLTLIGTGVSGIGALHSAGGTHSWAGAVSANGTINLDAGQLTLSGTVTGGLTKSGAGTLVLPAAAGHLSSVVMVGGTLVSNATGDTTTFSVTNGPLGSLVDVRGGLLTLAPAGSGKAVTLSTGVNGSFTTGTTTYDGSGTLALNRGANTSLTFTTGSLQRSNRGTLVLAPASGVLGSAESFKATGVTVVNGMATPSIVLQQNDSALSAGFVTYGTSTGFVAATPSASTDLNTAGATALFVANSTQILTGAATVAALEDNGQALSLGANTLTVGTGSTRPGSTNPVGVILNGGTLTGGILAANSQSLFDTGEMLVYASLAGGTISSQINASGGLTKFGPGTLALNGAVNVATLYAPGSTVAVKGGTLLVRGALTGDIGLTADSILAGTGKVAGAVTGGLISPGEGAGILTASSTGPGNFAFEFNQAGRPNFAVPTASGNDVLHLTSSFSFTSSVLGPANIISIYLSQAGGLGRGETFDGGFFVDGGIDFLSSIQNATFQYYLSDPTGSVLFDGVSYRSYTDNPIGVTTVATSADFGSGAVNGYLMELTIPEPAAWQMLALGVFVPWRRRRR